MKKLEVAAKVAIHNHENGNKTSAPFSSIRLNLVRLIYRQYSIPLTLQFICFPETKLTQSASKNHNAYT